MRALIGILLVAVVSVAAGCSQEGPPKFYLMGHNLGVTPQPGVASCPGCALKKNFAFGYDAVHGTATTMPSGMQWTQVRTYDLNWNPTDVSIPTPAPNDPFIYLLHVPSSTVSAVTNWYYQVGGVNFMDTTSLVVH